MSEIEARKRVFWSYTNRLTSAAGGTDDITITPAANSAMQLICACITMCDAAAARSTVVRICDEDGSVKNLVATSSLDNQSISLPSIGANVAGGNNSFSSGMIVPGDGSSFFIGTTALANNEWFDLSCTWELLGTQTAPTVARAGTGTLGSATQNEVTVVYC